jgi:putative membrane protein insertion efficiency factor
MQSLDPRERIIMCAGARRFLFSLALAVAVSVTPASGQAQQAGMKGPRTVPRQAEEAPPDISGRVFLSPIRFFQKHISPIDGPRCRFSPTCSSYGHQAIRKQGPWLGMLMTADRLMRCSYWTDGADYILLPNGKFSDPLADNLLED